jgi:hypothetical protein
MAGRTARWISALRTCLRRRGELLLESIILRHQLAVLQRTGTRRPCFRPADRMFWVLLSRLWVDWRRGLMIVQPATVLRWRCQGLRSIWTSGSRGSWRGGRPRIDREIRDLIVRMSQENFLWGAPRIHGELLKLGFDVSQATVSRYMPRPNRLPSQSWRTFLRNQVAGVGIVNFGEASGLPDRLRSLVSGPIERVVRYATQVRDDLLSAHTAPLATLRPGSSHFANCNRHANAGACIAVDPRSAPSRGAHWVMFDRRPSPYRSRASPRRELRHTRPSARSSSRQLRSRWRNRLIEGSARTFALHADRRARQTIVAERPPYARRLSATRVCVDQVLRTHRHSRRNWRSAIWNFCKERHVVGRSNTYAVRRKRS